ncbi:alpha/beta hydrolase [Limibacter armeniacum]|uniref:alpha/beta fold hydrolase n=1 Tax=Limibacter armeniacum TaxID=466084 RepID=UPI002FE59E22
MSQLEYTDQGSGPCIVLLHGFCECKEIWENLSAKLSKEFRVICPDMPGNGKSPLTDDVQSLSDYARKINETLQTASVETCVMIGHSLGGYVTLAYAEQFPDALSGIGLFHSTAFEDDDDKRENRDRAIEFVRQNGAEKFIKYMFPNLFSATTKDTKPEVIKQAIELCLNKCSIESVERASLAMKARPDRINIVKTFPKPILYIIGKEDQSVPLQKGLEQCYLPSDSHVHFMQEVGHMGMFEAPEKTLSTINSFAHYCYIQ